VNQSHQIRDATFVTNHISLEPLPQVGRNVLRRGSQIQEQSRMLGFGHTYSCSPRQSARPHGPRPRPRPRWCVEKVGLCKSHDSECLKVEIVICYSKVRNRLSVPELNDFIFDPYTHILCGTNPEFAYFPAVAVAVIGLHVNYRAEPTEADRIKIRPFLSLGQEHQNLSRDYVFKHP
jgi:hypothetical protein